MRPPFLYLDTGTCIEGAQEPAIGRLWPGIRKHAPRGTAFRASPLTVVELFAKLSRGSDTYFAKNQKPLRFLWSMCSEAKQYLPFPGVFVAKHLKGIQRPHPNFEPRDIRKWVQLAVFVRSRAELQHEDGFTLPGQTGFVRYRMEPAKLEPDFQRAKAHHVSRLERARSSRRPHPDIATWFAREVHDDDRTPVELQSFAPRFDAAYHLDQSLFELARNDSYDFGKHDTDFMDLQQLFYLCHDDAWFITTDKKLIGRIKASSQRDRVLTIQELARRFSVS